MKKLILLLALILTLSFISTACDVPDPGIAIDGEVGTLDIWVTENHLFLSPGLRASIDRFQEQNPGVIINLLGVSIGTYDDGEVLIDFTGSSIDEYSIRYVNEDIVIGRLHNNPDDWLSFVNPFNSLLDNHMNFRRNPNISTRETLRTPPSLNSFRWPLSERTIATLPTDFSDLNRGVDLFEFIERDPSFRTHEYFMNVFEAISDAYDEARMLVREHFGVSAIPERRLDWMPLGFEMETVRINLNAPRDIVERFLEKNSINHIEKVELYIEHLGFVGQNAWEVYRSTAIPINEQTGLPLNENHFFFIAHNSLPLTRNFTIHFGSRRITFTNNGSFSTLETEVFPIPEDGDINNFLFVHENEFQSMTFDTSNFSPPIPIADFEGRIQVYVPSDLRVRISPRSENQLLAWAFIKHLISEEEQSVDRNYLRFNVSAAGNPISIRRDVREASIRNLQGRTWDTPQDRRIVTAQDVESSVRTFNSLVRTPLRFAQNIVRPTWGW